MTGGAQLAVVSTRPGSPSTSKGVKSSGNNNLLMKELNRANHRIQVKDRSLGITQLATLPKKKGKRGTDLLQMVLRKASRDSRSEHSKQSGVQGPPAADIRQAEQEARGNWCIAGGGRGPTGQPV